MIKWNLMINVLSIYLSICLSIYLSIYQSINLSVNKCTIYQLLGDAGPTNRKWVNNPQLD